jgi:hypothetical protein
MLDDNTELVVQMARTLWFNTYRCKVTDALDNYIATLRITPIVPLDRSEVPEDAPTVVPFITVLVEDATFGDDEMVKFEIRLSEILIEELKNDNFVPEFCQFFYPSPPHLFEKSPTN